MRSNCRTTAPTGRPRCTGRTRYGQHSHATRGRSASWKHGSATLRHHDALIGCCRKAGFSIETAAQAFSLVDSYIYGFVLQKSTCRSTTPTTSTKSSSRSCPDEYPHLIELTTQHVIQPGYSYGNEFECGLPPGSRHPRNGPSAVLPSFVGQRSPQLRCWSCGSPRGTLASSTPLDRQVARHKAADHTIRFVSRATCYRPLTRTHVPTTSPAVPQH